MMQYRPTYRVMNSTIAVAASDPYPSGFPFCHGVMAYASSMKTTPASRLLVRKDRVRATVCPSYWPTSSALPASMSLSPTNMPALANTLPIASAMLVFPVPAPPMSMKFIIFLRNSFGSLRNADTTSTVFATTCDCESKSLRFLSAATRSSLYRWTTSSLPRTVSTPMDPDRRASASFRIFSKRDARSVASLYSSATDSKMCQLSDLSPASILAALFRDGTLMSMTSCCCRTPSFAFPRSSE